MAGSTFCRDCFFPLDDLSFSAGWLFSLKGAAGSLPLELTRDSFKVFLLSSCSSYNFTLAKLAVPFMGVLFTWYTFSLWLCRELLPTLKEMTLLVYELELY